MVGHTQRVWLNGGCSNLNNALIDLGENPKVNLLSAISINDPSYGGIYNFLCTFSSPPGCTSYEHKKIRRDSRCYTIFNGVLYRQEIDGVLRQAIDAKEASKVVKQYHNGFCGGHYATDYIAKKILHAGYYWPTLFKDVTLHCKTCEFCQFFGRKDFTTRQCRHTRVRHTRQVTSTCMVMHSYSSIGRVYRCMQ